MCYIEKLLLSPRKGVWQEVCQAKLLQDRGAANDRFADGETRQLSLCDGAWRDRIQKSEGFCSKVGANIITRKLDYASLRVGDRLRMGDVQLVITRVGKECHTDCACYGRTPPCLFHRHFAFARVLCGGEVTAGVEIERI